MTDWLPSSLDEFLASAEQLTYEELLLLLGNTNSGIERRASAKWRTDTQFSGFRFLYYLGPDNEIYLADAGFGTWIYRLEPDGNWGAVTMFKQELPR
jgi:hypothetical protein